jgi:hypothetical protein
MADTNNSIWITMTRHRAEGEPGYRFAEWGYNATTPTHDFKHGENQPLIGLIMAFLKQGDPTKFYFLAMCEAPAVKNELLSVSAIFRCDRLAALVQVWRDPADFARLKTGDIGMPTRVAELHGIQQIDTRDQENIELREKIKEALMHVYEASGASPNNFHRAMYGSALELVNRARRTHKLPLFPDGVYAGTQGGLSS